MALFLPNTNSLGLFCYISAHLLCSRVLVALGARWFRAGPSHCGVLLAPSRCCCWLEVAGCLHRLLHAVDGAWSHDHLGGERKGLGLLLLKLLVLLLLHLLWG